MPHAPYNDAADCLSNHLIYRLLAQSQYYLYSIFLAWVQTIVEIYTDCNGELVGELFRTEIICGSMWYLSNSIQNDHHHSHGNYQFLWAKILLIQEITPLPLHFTLYTLQLYSQ